MEGTSDKLATFIDLSGPDLTDEEVEAVLSVLRTRHLSLGPKLAEFEEVVAGYVGRRHGVAVNSGTSALHLAVRALGIGEGEEVITTPFSFIASSNCLLYERAVPRFVDIDPLTFNIDCDQVETALTERTKALLAVDVFGLPADWDHLRRIADTHGLRLIDDSCEALGASRKVDGRGWAMAGSFGDAGTFAFYPNKQITTGEGGMVVTDDGDVAELCRSMRNQGRDSGAEWLRHARLGYNYRLSDINCALGIAQMSRIDQILAARRRVAGWYEEMLRDIEGVVAPAEAPDTRRSWFVYVVRLAMCQSWQDLDEVVRRLRGRGIGCSNYFYPIHLQPFYREMFGYEEGDFPVTESTSKQTLALPFHNRLSRQSVARVVDALRTTLDELDLGA
jgi:perosamine synthetase